MKLEELDNIADDIREEFEIVSTARDLAYQRSRKLVSLCSKTIRALHREDWQQANDMLLQVKTSAQELIAGVADYPVLYHAGYTQDSLKEYVEACLTEALILDKPFPMPAELGVESSTWLNGLAEAATEMRRRILDIIRQGHNEEAERLLGAMDAIYGTLVTIDFNDKITGGLRRRTDTVRAVLERTRGDLTTSFRQAKLEAALKALEAKVNDN